MDFFELLTKITGTLAIIIGGVWAYYKYVKGRLFHPRLELQIEGRIILESEIPHLFLNYEIKNIGLSKVDIDKESSCIIVMKYHPPNDSLEIENAYWEERGVFPVLEKHSWIESSEVIKEDSLYSITEINNVIYRAELRIVGKGKSWEALAIIFCNYEKKEG